jgi:branched-chain amino acid aminotransferase
MINEIASINVTRTENSKINQVNWDNIPFGKVFSDHMLVMDYVDGKWQQPEILPYGNLSLNPATSAIHYGQSVFEGMKANKTEAGEIILFRPEMNAKRFKESCERMCMATIEEDVFVELVRKLVDVDRDWVSSKEDYSLYIRPFMFAMDDFIGVKPSDTYRFVIFTCPVGMYYSEPVSVKIEEHYTRAAQGGVGTAKTAGNYAAALYPALLCQKEGFHQLVWTDAKEHKYIEESGTMNILFVIDGVLVTPAEDTDTILKGTTKRTVIEVANEWGMKVEERKVSVEEVIEGAKSGKITEVFGAGTAATIAHIVKIGFRGEVFNLSPVSERTFSNKVKAYLDGLKAGKIEDVKNWCLTV